MKLPGIRTVPLYITGSLRGLNGLVILVDPSSYFAMDEMNFPNATASERAIVHSLDQVFFSFTYTLVFCILVTSATLGTSNCHAHLNLALVIICGYLGLEESFLLVTSDSCAGATDFGEQGVQWTPFIAFLGMGAMHLAAVDWQVLSLRPRSLCSSLSWGMWFYIVLVVILFPFARLSPEGTLERLFSGEVGDPQIRSFMECGSKTFATVQLANACALLAVIFSGDPLVACSMERLLGAFGLLSLYVHFSTNTLLESLGFGSSAVPSSLKLFFFVLWLSLTWGPVMRLDYGLRGVMEGLHDYTPCD